MSSKTMPQIVEIDTHAKGVDSLPVKKQDALIQVFGLTLNSINMTRHEKLGFVDARLKELRHEGAINALLQQEPELFDRLSSIMGVEKEHEDENWIERVHRMQTLEAKILALA